MACTCGVRARARRTLARRLHSALARFAFKIHREGLAWGTMGAKGLCNKYPMPVLRKQQYRVAQRFPNRLERGVQRMGQQRNVVVVIVGHARHRLLNQGFSEGAFCPTPHVA